MENRYEKQRGEKKMYGKEDEDFNLQPGILFLI